MAPGVAPQPRVAGRIRPVFKINTTEHQHCLPWNRLHIRSVSSPQLFEVDSHPKAEELDDDVEIDLKLQQNMSGSVTGLTFVSDISGRKLRINIPITSYKMAQKSLEQVHA